ncbi:hypothetical protein ACTQ49_04170 [Luteococcus sp. Sow4_B9]|uniref:hypothetical protein n=1 Tax=Luteococcus sp. Sow4_B9 TaxID=3438792 RepID=UPI003F9E0A7E
MNTAQLVLPAVAGLSAWAMTRWMVPRLPEPGDAQQDGWTKVPYALLADAPGQLTSLVAGSAAGLVCSGQPLWTAPVLVTLAGPVASLVLVDLRTTWLPLPLTRASWALSGVGAIASLTAAPDGLAVGTAVVMALAVAVTFLLFWGLWRIGLGIGYGDVRLAPLLALGGACVSLRAWWLGLLLGTAVGAVWGLLNTLWRRRHPHPMGDLFAYGPSLWLGMWLGLAVA